MALLTKQYERLARDERAFDEKLMRSALAFYNSIYAGEPGVESAFGWVPEVLKLRAERDGIDPTNFRWDNKETGMQVMATMTVLLYNVGAFKESLKKRGAITLQNRRIPAEKWLDEILGTLPIYSRFVSQGGGVRFVSVPCLTNVQRCVAYAIALIKLDRHGFGSLVRPCPFLKRDIKGLLAHHYFLADEPRQRYCSPAHSNAHRQYKWRHEHQAPRKLK